MNDAIKKMLEPVNFCDHSVSKEDAEKIVRGFLKLMEQRNECLRCLSRGEPADYLGDIEDRDAELEAAMRGNE